MTLYTMIVICVFIIAFVALFAFMIYAAHKWD